MGENHRERPADDRLERLVNHEVGMGRCRAAQEGPPGLMDPRPRGAWPMPGS